jgi:hypothetical protein
MKNSFYYEQETFFQYFSKKKINSLVDKRFEERNDIEKLKKTS